MAQVCLYDLSKPNLYLAGEKMFTGSLLGGHERAFQRAKCLLP